MANIVFKTRGNSNPQGKSRVYFCAHPKDYGVFFEEISEDILKYQNCAIWYDSEPTADYDKEDLLSRIGDMNLFVIPVTYRFLKEDCRARTVEFQYAIDNHIPVLPLMQEDGLDALFNEICGDLQFLYKGEKDDTAISFDEKLEKFLNSVLIGDELAEKIRAAFDAYIFCISS